MNAWKNDIFRPAILDTNRSIRKRYHKLWKKSDLTKEAFNRKFAEVGVEAMEKIMQTSNTKLPTNQ